MPRFFLPPGDRPSGGQYTMTGEDARHLGISLRARPGDSLTLCDGQGNDHHCVITRMTAATVEVSVTETQPSQGEPNVEVTIYQCLPKGDKMETVVQKAVELGAVQIVPVLSARCVSRPDGKSMEKKLERYRKIAREAAMQCGRGRLPEVGEAVSFWEMCNRFSQYEGVFLPYEQGGVPLRQAFDIQERRIACIIGPEGGFAPEEAETAVRQGARCVTLGPRILRTETAALCFLAATLYEYDNMR